MQNMFETDALKKDVEFGLEGKDLSNLDRTSYQAGIQACIKWMTGETHEHPLSPEKSDFIDALHMIDKINELEDILDSIHDDMETGIIDLNNIADMLEAEVPKNNNNRAVRMKRLLGLLEEEVDKLMHIRSNVDEARSFLEENQKYSNGVHYEEPTVLPK